MNVWREMWDAIRDDFSDLESVPGLTRITVRLVLAAALGAVLGWDREMKHKTAGLRTHMLVGLGAALFVLISKEAGHSTTDQARVLQGLLAGIGFLCAGAILHQRREGEVAGFTTAAGLWLTAAIGVAAGLGREGLALLSAFLSWAILVVLPKIVQPFEPKKKGDDQPQEESSRRIQV
jgi:putative Mg2+ transporter-C (MgtC) family protein